jgi:hypothetical protein
VIAASAIGAYACVTMKNGGKLARFLAVSDIEKVRGFALGQERAVDAVVGRDGAQDRRCAACSRMPRCRRRSSRRDGPRHNHAARRVKAAAVPALRDWLCAGGRFEIWSWRLKGAAGKRKMYELRREELTLDDLTSEVAPASAPTSGGAA